MSDSKSVVPDHEIHELIAGRWSPYVFDPKEVDKEKIWSCFEAARWAASSYNEQPWSFFVAFRSEPNRFDKLLSCLLEANQEWAKHASALVITVIAKHFTRNNKLNRVAMHDLGLAVGNLSIQASHLDLSVHQMGGIDLELTREKLQIPESHDPVTAIAIGYRGSESDNAVLVEKDQSPRERKPISEFVFSEEWGKSAIE